ncbi:MAG: DUF4238 domain-containing protein [Crocinitomicaceae bacterium]|nr:DUF4238 domain-containing protein [Flavobacteriales bacterium]NQZ37270.1 DUF4238 domain-containing protein [Crocinitomicaceae bacterium]
MKKENQHFLPRAFLKHFCIDRKSEIYESRFIGSNEKWLKPISKHTNSISYSEDIYNVSLEFAKKNGISSEFVERNSFWYEKGYMDELISKVENDTVQQSDIEKLPDFYLSMISRNPVFMNGFDPTKTDNLLDKQLANLQKESKWVKKMARLTSNKKLNKWFAVLRSKFVVEQTQEQMYSMSMYKQYTGQSAAYKEIMDEIQGYKVMIGRIRNDDHFFLTSDSPGFSVCRDRKVYPLKFKDDAFHYMPISSKVMVALLHPVYSFDAPQFSVVDVTLETLNYINDGTIKASSEYVYCENKEFLFEILANRRGK